MKILVFGAGVLGCNLAKNLFRAGNDVTLLSASGTAARSCVAASATATISPMAECTRSFAGAGQKRWGVATTAAISA